LGLLLFTLDFCSDGESLLAYLPACNGYAASHRIASHGIEPLKLHAPHALFLLLTLFFTLIILFYSHPEGGHGTGKSRAM
jgi:hypothetical protein